MIKIHLLKITMIRENFSTILKPVGGQVWRTRGNLYPHGDRAHLLRRDDVRVPVPDERP